MIFKNVDARSLDVLIKSLPSVTRPALRKEIIEIDGRDGYLSRPLGYKYIKKEVSLIFQDDSRMYEIMAWLNGIGPLILDNEPEVYYEAEIDEESLIISEDQIGKYKRIDCIFLCQPFKKKINDSPIHLKKNGYVFNSGNMVCQPKIKIEGNGMITFKLNGKEIFSINVDGYVYVDSEVMDAYKENTHDLKNMVMQGDFPLLVPGNNHIEIVGEFTKVTFTMNTRYL